MGYLGKYVVSSDNSAVKGFEQSLEALETIVTSLESGDLSLEDSLQVFEQGIKLTRHCQSALERAEQKVQQLTEQNQIEPLSREPD